MSYLDQLLGDPDFEFLTPGIRGVQLGTQHTREMRLRRSATRAKSTKWEPWVKEFFPKQTRYQFSSEQRKIWEWAQSIADGTPLDKVRPIAAILPRGAGKTTTLDLVSLFLLCVGARRYVLIVASTMNKSKARVKSIQRLLMDKKLAAAYPEIAEPAVNHKGVSLGWSDYILRMTSGQTVQASSMGSDNRGFNEGHDRPDVIILDDIDKKTDSPGVTKKKEDTITTSILPTAGDSPAAVCFIQNLILQDGVAGRLVSGESLWAQDKILIGPVKAIEGLEYERHMVDVPQPDGPPLSLPRYKITKGVATWEGQTIEMCEDKMNTWGVDTFMLENQHYVLDSQGALWTTSDIVYAEHAINPLRDLSDRVVGVDPDGGADVYGIVVCGSKRAIIGHRKDDAPIYGRIYYVLEDASVESGIGARAPEEVVCEIAEKYAARVVVEDNYGGDTNIRAIKTAHADLKRKNQVKRALKIEPVHASEAKKTRAKPVKALYTAGLVFHCGKHAKLEAQQTTWVPHESTNSPNLLDALVHSINALSKRVNHGPASGRR
jgi:hypothetical protein